MARSSFRQALHALKVLIVDDHEINREFLRIGLAPRVARVETAADGCRPSSGVETNLSMSS